VRLTILYALEPVVSVDDVSDLRQLYAGTSPDSPFLRPAILKLVSTIRAPESAHFAASILVGGGDTQADAREAYAAVKALGEIGETRYAPLLQARLPASCAVADEQNRSVLFRAIQQLTPPDETLTLLSPFLACDAARTRLAAAEAISYATSEAALAAIERWFDEEPDSYVRLQSDVLLWRLRDALERMPPLPGE
jgi:HEAT repeat protein